MRKMRLYNLVKFLGFFSLYRYAWLPVYLQYKNLDFCCYFDKDNKLPPEDNNSMFCIHINVYVFCFFNYHNLIVRAS